jgi:hypothetical protein
MRQPIIYLILILLLAGCSSAEDKGKLVAKVYDEELYEADYSYLFDGENLSIEDSTALSDDYIDNWVNEQILVNAAKNEEGLDENKIENKTNHFRNELYILELEQILVNEKLDTVISDKEIKEYYDLHKNEFQLNDYLVKVLYLKVASDAPDVEDLGNKYKLRKETDIEEIEIFAKIYASNFYYDEDNWIYFDDLLKEIPLQDINKDRFIMKRSKTRFEENGFYYFLNIIDYKLKNTISPLNFERDNIKERIMNMRIMKLREEIKKDIIAKAYEKDAIIVY